MKTEIINIRVEPDVKALAESCAKLESKTVSNFFEFLVRRYAEVRRVDVIEQAQKLNEYGINLPNLKVGQICNLEDIWDGNGEIPECSYSYLLTDSGLDGDSNVPVWIDYQFKVVTPSPLNPLKTVVKLIDIKLL